MDKTDERYSGNYIIDDIYIMSYGDLNSDYSTNISDLNLYLDNPINFTEKPFTLLIFLKKLECEYTNFFLCFLQFL